jgi:hypothetical protein
VPVLIAPKSETTFSATFDKGVDADYALGCGVLEAKGGLVDDGKGGKAVGLEGASIKMRPHLLLNDEVGRVTFRGQVPEKAAGTVITLGVLSVQLKYGKEPQMILALEPTAKDATDGATVTAPAPAAGWHDFDVTWANGKATLSMDGKSVGEVAIRPLQLAGTGKGNRPNGVLFGGRNSLVAIDDIRCYRQ